MSKPSNYGPGFDLEDTLGGFLDTVAKICLYAGLLALVVSGAFLGYYFYLFASNPGNADQTAALSNVGLFGKVLVVGGVTTVLGSTYLYWGEEILCAGQLILSGLLWFAPFYLPMIISSANALAPSAAALAALQMGGTVMGILSLGVLIVDLAIKAKQRMQQGIKKDTLRYGKGVKEEKDVRNVFMGKCWQLPYCRKFVRERCPIYHSRRTCWKERVGCMCEEEVIRNAMENRTIPKDAVAAAKYIPVNNRITMAQKRERCRQCVIFNEHLKHQYRLALPLTVGAFGALAVVGWGTMQAITMNLLSKLDVIFKKITFNNEAAVSGAFGSSLGWFQNVFLACFLVVTLAYVLKALEYVIFKLKV